MFLFTNGSWQKQKHNFKIRFLFWFLQELEYAVVSSGLKLEFIKRHEVEPRIKTQKSENDNLSFLMKMKN